jgi:hypothetical protein
MKGIQFTLEEKQLIVEALLFTSSADICSDHTEAHRLKMVDIAIKLNESLGKLYNIYLYKTSIVEDNTTNIIMEKIKNIPYQDIISDETDK